jgi:hypothetical protein
VLAVVRRQITQITVAHDRIRALEHAWVWGA